ncbi:T9SS C-terminal target domain-containing protein [Postechiella marina]|uniref:T9SS C-terminal target domain-containing protein n=1 Tax=Postechiella marina TaxID=943941 RepID=A0ABP8C1L7_9FLAO
MKNILPLIILLLFVLPFYGQKEANNWYFGANSGIQFNSDGSTTNLSNGKLNTLEGCASISDSDGNLLLYTDGITVWNKLHQPMPNANSFTGSGLWGDPSSSQSAIIVPKPEDPNIYYIFTVDTSSFEGDIDSGFNYTIIDLRLDGGLGDVVPASKNINLLNDSSEKISAVLKDCISKSIWVITFASETGLTSTSLFNNFNTFYAYEVAATGLVTTPVKSTFPSISINDQRGYLKLSPDGKKLACANSTDGLYLYDFNPDTGVVSNQQALNIQFSTFNKPQSPYGVEFSQNNEFLYVSSYYNPPIDFFLDPASQYSALLQYDLTAANINASEFVLEHRQMYRGALQLGPNGKIYRAMNSTYAVGLPYLSVINTPNKRGLEANYQHNAIRLSSESTQGLPPFISSFFSEKINITKKETNSNYLALCNGEKFTLKAENIPGATYNWFFNDAPITESDFDLEVSKPGLYRVLIQSTTGDCSDLLEGEVLVEYFDPPVANPINNILICDTNNDSKHIFNFTDQVIEGLGMQSASHYNIKFFTSQSDADLNSNEILGNFENTENPQTIYTRVGLNENPTCFDTSINFSIQVFNTPIANNVMPISICDTKTPTDSNTSNGLTDIDLHLFDDEILGSQSSTEFVITYYKNNSDAVIKANALSYNFTNQTAFNTSIYARIENILNEECYAVSNAIEITINSLPEFTNTNLLQCDEDGINDQITSFNLTEAQTVLTNNTANRAVHYFKTLSDAKSDQNEILNTENYKNEKNPQTLYAQIINTDTNCKSITQLTLQISTTNINNYNVPLACDELNSEDGINTFNLNDIALEMQSLNSITYPITFYENYDDALTEQNTLASNYNNSTPYSQIIYARAENNNACYGISEVLLTVAPLPKINTETRTYYCLNKYPETITINADIVEGTPTDYTYKWSNGDTTYQTQINEIGIYTVDVTNNSGCTKQRTITVEASGIAAFEIPEYKVVDPSNNNTVTVFASGPGIYEYALFDKTNTTIYRNYQSNTLFENVLPGIYTINVKDAKNNCGTINVAVSVIGFPKYFTPNNDGVNDYWQIKGTSTMFQAGSKILIFNRYGKLIKQLNPTGNGWDGLFNGEKLPADDYWFSITLEDGRIFKNHFTLKY